MALEVPRRVALRMLWNFQDHLDVSSAIRRSGIVRDPSGVVSCARRYSQACHVTLIGINGSYLMRTLPLARGDIKRIRERRKNREKG